jgi:hypothetical protein
VVLNVARRPRSKQRQQAKTATVNAGRGETESLLRGAMKE